MIISITITLAVAIALFALIGGVLFLGRRLATEGSFEMPSFGGWRWYPSPIAILVLVGAVALIAFRFFPAFIVIPFILPFIFRRGGGGGLGGIFRFPGRNRDEKEDDDHSSNGNGNGNPRRPPWS